MEFLRFWGFVGQHFPMGVTQYGHFCEKYLRGNNERKNGKVKAESSVERLKELQKNFS